MLGSAATALTLTAAPLATAQPANVLPPWGQVAGQTQADLSAAWVRWIMSIPADVTPLFDATGERCGEGQTGPVWFLAGDWLDDPVVRRCTVPKDAALFFPVANAWWIQTPYDAPWDEQAIRELLRGDFGMDDPGELSCEIDGVNVGDITRYRVESPVFTTYLRSGNVFDSEAYPIGDGTYGPNVGDGYYLLVPPLKPGLHTIHIRAPKFGQDILYRLSVK